MENVGVMHDDNKSMTDLMGGGEEMGGRGNEKGAGNSFSFRWGPLRDSDKGGIIQARGGSLPQLGSGGGA